MHSTRKAFLFSALSLSIASAARTEEHALRFGGGQFLLLPPLEVSSPFAVELWMRPGPSLLTASEPVPLLEWSGSFRIRLSASTVQAGADLGGSAPLWVSAPGIEPGRWVHLAADFDGRRMRLFVDGVLANVRIAIGSLVPHPGRSSEMGAIDDVPGRRFAGEIDEVRWWSRVRTEEEIRADYRSKLGGGERGLAGYWSFDEGAGQVAFDRGPGARHAVLGMSRFSDAGDPSWTESTSPVRKTDEGYRLLFDPAGPLSLTSGEEFKVLCVLSCPEAAGAPPLRTWSISLRHDRLLLFLVNVGLRGTTIEPQAARGFFRFERLDGREGAGFIGRGVLDDGGEALPATGEISLAAATYRPLAPRGPGEAVTRLRYEEGLVGEAGLARNSIRAGARQILPAETSLEVRIHAPAVALRFEQESGLRIAPKADFEVGCLLAVTENPGEGPQSWSISVRHDPQVLEILDATTDGTVVERAAAQTGVFQITELVNNASGTGFLSAIIMGIDRPFSLPSTGEEKIARARYRLKEGVPVGTLTEISYRDGLQQSGVPIENLIVFRSGPSQPQKGSLPVLVVPETFIRGDFSSDRQVNMTDVASLIFWLYRKEYEPQCLEAGDANDDGVLDVSDPVFLLRALFQGESQPPAPYPAPGPDATPDSLGCNHPEN